MAEEHSKRRPGALQTKRSPISSRLILEIPYHFCVEVGGHSLVDGRTPTVPLYMLHIVSLTTDRGLDNSSVSHTTTSPVFKR